MEQQEVEEVLSQAIEKAEENIRDNPIVAEVLLRQILRCVPEHSRALTLLGLTLHRLKRFVECVEILQMAIEVEPDNADNYNNIALAYGCLEQHERALEYSLQAIQRKSTSHIFYNNLAIHYRQLGRHDEAIDALRKALAIHEDAPIWANLGGIYGELKDLDTAIDCFHKAIAIDPNCAGAHVDLAFSYHLQGRHAEGFKEAEWRTEHFSQMRFYKNAYDQTKRWAKPGPVDGKRVLIYAEQGLGDMLMSARWLKKLKSKGAEVIVHCDPCLNKLLLSVDGVDRVVNRDISTGKGEEFPEYDLQCCAMSLPYLLDDFTMSGAPYFHVKGSIDIRENYPDTFNIGICWAGSPAHPNDACRSMYLRHFRALTEVPGVKLFSLQKDTRPRVRKDNKTAIDLTEGCSDMRLVDMAPYMEDFVSTLVIAKNLDLVISVDTALLHLCGGGGVPAWGLIPFNPDWRWGFDKENTDWYDSVKLFRQDKPGNWAGVIDRVVERLKAR